MPPRQRSHPHATGSSRPVPVPSLLPAPRGARSPPRTGRSSAAPTAPASRPRRRRCRSSSPPRRTSSGPPTLGDGIGSPVVAAGRVFTTAMTDPKDKEPKLLVYRVRRRDGQEAVEAGDRRRPEERCQDIHQANSYASASPAADAERVYVYFLRTGLTAFDAKTGKQVWNLPLPEPFFIFDWGPGMSPVLYKDTLFFCQDDDLFPALYAVNKKTGKVLWKDDRSDMAVSYSHPVICETQGRPGAGGGRHRQDPRLRPRRPASASGRRSWTAATSRRRRSSTTASCTSRCRVTACRTSGGRSPTPTATARSRATRSRPAARTRAPASPRRSGRSSSAATSTRTACWKARRSTWRSSTRPTRAASSTARRAAGRATAPTGRSGTPSCSPTSSIQAVKGGGKGDVTKTHVLWKVKTTQPRPPRLAAAGRRPVCCSSRAAASPAPSATKKGELLWEKQRIGITSQILAQPVYGDGKIYVTGQNGKIAVLSLGEKLKVLARTTWARTASPPRPSPTGGSTSARGRSCTAWARREAP